MKFKVLKGSELFRLLSEVHKKMEEATAAAKAVSKEVKADAFCQSDRGVAGGISAFVFNNYKSPGDNWKSLDRHTSKMSRFHFPKRNKRNKELLATIDSLPIVKATELSRIFKYKSQSFSTDQAGLVFSTSPGIEWHISKGYILVTIHENAKYKPIEGLTEIMVSEYQKLSTKKS